MKTNITLKSVRLSNTHVSSNIVTRFQKFLKAQRQLQCFRWINVVGLADQGSEREFATPPSFQPDYCDDLNQIISITCGTSPVSGSRGIYLNPYIGDLQRDLIEAIYKCQYMDR